METQDLRENRRRFGQNQVDLTHSVQLTLSAIAVGLLLFAGCSSSAFKGFKGLRAPEPDSVSSKASTPDTGASAAIGSAVTETSPTGWLENFEQAKAESRRTGKPILAEFTGSDWCHYCKRLSADVFSKPEFEEWASENVVLLELDYPKYSPQSRLVREQNEMLKEKFNIEQYPTILLIDADEKVLGKMGYQKDPEQFIRTASRQLSGGILFGGNGLKLR